MAKIVIHNFAEKKIAAVRQQIIYRRKGNLSESPNHFKYRKNILISRFYEHFREVVGFRPFLKVQKNFKLLEHKHIIYDFEARDLEIPNI